MNVATIVHIKLKTNIWLKGILELALSYLSPGVLWNVLSDSIFQGLDLGIKITESMAFLENVVMIP